MIELPSELQVEVFKRCCSHSDAANLALSCRLLWSIYETSRARITLHITQTSIVAPLIKFYEFLQKLKLEDGAVQYAPPEGWTNIPHHRYSPLVTESLERMPYLDVPETAIAFRSVALCYHEYDTESWPFPKPPYGTEERNIRDHFNQVKLHNLIAISEGLGSGAKQLILDVFHARLYVAWMGMCQAEDEGDLKTWVEKSIDSLESLSEVFLPDNFWGFPGPSLTAVSSDCDFVKLEAAGENAAGGPFREDDVPLSPEWVALLYRKFGWQTPDWRRHDCQNAINKYTRGQVERWHDANGGASW